MKELNYKAVVFDMDGVIFDTEKLVVLCWKRVADKYNIEDIEATCKACMGCNQDTARIKFKEIYGENFPYDEYKAEMREYFYNDCYGEHLPLKKGAVELLQSLKNKNIPVALATSTRKELVLKELKDAKIDIYFDKVICGDMVEHSKPHPEIFLKACEELGVLPKECLAIEDSLNGIRAAYAGGLIPIMVPDMIEPTDEIKEMTYDIVDSLIELL